jgi:uracil-DNA glycosylase
MARIANPKEIVSIYYDKLKESNWDSIMRTYVNSSEFQNVFKYLLQEVEDDNRFTPPLRYLMEPFTNCNYNDLKVVFIADSPYNIINVANGLAFSHPVSLSKELALKVLHNKISSEVYNEKRQVSTFNTDLRVWAEQGVLLLNSSFTTTINKSCRHYDLWKPFISHMIDMLNDKHQNIVYVLFGKNAQYYNDLIDPDENLLIELDNPGDTGYKWDSQDVFNRINQYLRDNGKLEIVW